ncbi:hypothetical protein V8E53_002240 [Lactarius tabidus]
MAEKQGLAPIVHFDRNRHPLLPESRIHADLQALNPEFTHTVASTVAAQLDSFAYLKTYIFAITWECFPESALAASSGPSLTRMASSPPWQPTVLVCSSSRSADSHLTTNRENLPVMTGPA